MWLKLVTLLLYLNSALSQTPPSGIERTLPGGMSSKGYKVIYGDDDMAKLNEVVDNMENNDFVKAQKSFVQQVKPMPAKDVKCLMSLDKYCSPEMKQTKDLLIKALKTGCSMCANAEMEIAGRVVMAMMVHDPVAWKLFLTRSALQTKSPKKPSLPENPYLRPVGEPEILESNYRQLYPGVKVRVKRYYSEKFRSIYLKPK